MLTKATAAAAEAADGVGSVAPASEFAPLFLGVAIIGLFLTAYVYRHRRKLNVHHLPSLALASGSSSFSGSEPHSQLPLVDDHDIIVDVSSINIQTPIEFAWSSDTPLYPPLPGAAKLKADEVHGLQSSTVASVGAGLSSKLCQRIPAGLARTRLLLQQQMQRQLLLRSKQQAVGSEQTVDNQQQEQTLQRLPAQTKTDYSKPRNTGWSFPPFEDKFGRFQRWQRVLRRRPPPARPPQPALPCPMPVREMTEALLSDFELQLREHQQTMWGLGDWFAMAEDERLRLLPLATNDMVQGKSLPVHCLPKRDGEESEVERRERRGHLRAWLRQYLLHTLMRAGPAKSLSPIREQVEEDEWRGMDGAEGGDSEKDEGGEEEGLESRKDGAVSMRMRMCQWWDSEEVLQVRPMVCGVTRDHLWLAVALLASSSSS